MFKIEHFIMRETDRSYKIGKSAQIYVSGSEKSKLLDERARLNKNKHMCCSET